MIRAVDSIIAGASTKNIIVKATPGSGKSTIPIIAGKLISAGLADKICWICPRMTLQDQAERNFLDPFFRKMFGHHQQIRSSTNEWNGSRGTEGMVTTYQALGVDTRQTVLDEFRRRRYILILDEYHHAEENGEWTKALLPLYEHAAFRVLMTGTLSRGDKKRIAFTPYVQAGESFLPNLEGDHETVVIEYGRRDALDDHAIIPLNFIFTDGNAKWETKSGKLKESPLSTYDSRNANHALYTALHTEYALELLSTAVRHWQKHKQTANPYAQLLVVSAGIERAKEYTEYLKGLGVSARIATSDDGPEAVKAIKEFKAGKFGVIVTCQMAYEGMDCPSISHEAVLTRIRTAEWIEQCVCRANRIDPHGGPYENQQGFIFAPHDQTLLEIVEKIKADQTAPAIEAWKGNGNGRAKAGETDLFRMRVTPGGITPISSQMTGARELPIDHEVSPEETMTISEREALILEKIESHVRTWAFNNRYSPKKLNAEIRAWAGKPRSEMTLRELEACLEHVRRTYPIERVRGTGRRAPTKAAPFPCNWMERSGGDQ